MNEVNGVERAAKGYIQNYPVSRQWFEKGIDIFFPLAHQKSTRPKLKSLLLAEASVLGCHVAACKKAFSPVNDQAVWADRHFQQNRPIAVGLLSLRGLRKISEMQAVFPYCSHMAFFQTPETTNPRLSLGKSGVCVYQIWR
jgi:hypothetical protein